MRMRNGDVRGKSRREVLQTAPMLSRSSSGMQCPFSFKGGSSFPTCLYAQGKAEQRTTILHAVQGLPEGKGG